MSTAKIETTGQGYPANAVLRIDLPKNADERVLATMHGIAGMNDEARNMPYVRQVATLLRRAASEPNGAPEGIPPDLFELFRLIRRRFMFKADPPGHELVRFADYWADRLLRLGDRMQADCDDIAAFAVAVVTVLGYKAALVVIGPTETGTFTHIFYGAYVNGGLVYFDPQEMRAPGEHAPAKRMLRMDL